MAEPKDLDPNKVLLGRRIMEAREALGMKPVDLARRLGVSRASVSQWEAGQSGLSVTRLRKVASILNLSLEWMGIGQGAFEGEMTPDGELVDLKKIKAADAAMLRGLIGKQKAEIWLLTSDTLSAVHRKGSYLVVVRDRVPKAGDRVLAMMGDVPIFRGLLPPHLLMSVPGPQPAPIPIDDPGVRIAGVVTGGWMPSP